MGEPHEDHPQGGPPGQAPQPTHLIVEPDDDEDEKDDEDEGDEDEPAHA